MSVFSNSVNYATPLYGSIAEESFADSAKYFSLHENKLDGTWVPIGEQSPLWSAEISDSNGSFTTPIIIETVPTPRGKNLCSGYFHKGFIDLNDGHIFDNGTYPNSVYSDVIAVKPGDGLVCSGIDNSDMRWRGFDSKMRYFGNLTVGTACVIPDGVSFIRVLWHNGLTEAERAKVQVERSAVATAYESPTVDTIHSLSFVGDKTRGVYPTEFTYTLYNKESVIYTKSITGNTKVDYVLSLDKVYEATRIVLSISKINKASYTCRITNSYNKHIIVRSTRHSIRTTETTDLSSLLYKTMVDTLRLKSTESSNFVNTTSNKDRLLIPIGTGAQTGHNLTVPVDMSKVKQVLVHGPANRLAVSKYRQNLARGTSKSVSRNLTGQTNECTSSYIVDARDLRPGDVITTSFTYTYSNLSRVPGVSPAINLQGSGSDTGWFIAQYPGKLFTSLVDLDSGSGSIDVAYSATLSPQQARNETFSVNFRHDYIASGSASVTNFKVVKGSVMDAWCPSPFDNLNVDGVIQNVTIPELLDVSDTYNPLTGDACIGGVASNTKVTMPTLTAGQYIHCDNPGAVTLLYDDEVSKITNKLVRPESLKVNHTSKTVVQNSFGSKDTLTLASRNGNLFKGSKDFTASTNKLEGWNRNVFTASKDTETDCTILSLSATGNTSNKFYAAFSPLIPVYEGEVFTFSVDIKVDDLSAWDNQCHSVIEFSDSSMVRIKWYDVYINSRIVKLSKPMENNTWVRVTYTLTASDEYVASTLPGYTFADVKYFGISLRLFKNGSISFRRPKLERGTVETMWVDDSLSTEVSSIEASLARPDTLSTKLYEDLYFTADVRSNDKLIPIIGRDATIGNVIRLEDSAVDNLSVSGPASLVSFSKYRPNLMPNTNMGNLGWHMTMSTGGEYKLDSVTELGVNALKLTIVKEAKGWCVLFRELPTKKFKEFTTYTISFDFRSSIGTNIGMSFRDTNGLNGMGTAPTYRYSTPNEWDHVTVTLTTNEVEPRGQSFYIVGLAQEGIEYFIANLRIEEGDTEYPWLPAPEDNISIPGLITTKAIPTLTYEYDFFNLITGETCLNRVSTFKEPITPVLFDGAAYVSTDGYSNVVAYYNDTEAPTLTNIHTVMKKPSRRTYGKIYVTYMNPLVDEKLSVASSGTAYNTSVEQVVNSRLDTKNRLLFLSNNKLDGTYYPIGYNEEAGWWSTELSNADGTFASDPSMKISFSPRLLMDIRVISSKRNDIVLIDYTVNITSNGIVKAYEVVGNALYDNPIVTEALGEVSAVEVVVHKINKANCGANIMEIPVTSTVEYMQDNLISIDLLEELSYKDDVEALGGVSANELTVMINNADKQFYFNNDESIISKQLKKNRKIVAYLGAEVVPGQIEWYDLGTYWSYSWDVPVGGLYARVTAFDTIGLLGTFTFKNHSVYKNYSVGQLIDVVLTDAQNTYTLLEWEIQDTLYDIKIPYAWFENSNHMAALERLAQCARINIYCDRKGRIVATERYSNFSNYYDVWADNTNIISKNYPTLYTDAPNTINVSITSVKELHGNVAQSTLEFSTEIYPTFTVTSSNPIVGDVNVTIDADEGVSYAYEVYSWGVVFSFTGAGTVRSITVDATYLEVKVSTVITSSDIESVQLNGVNTMEITHDLIQTANQAKLLADSILSDASVDKYDTDIDYRGDIALSINDPIKLLNGIAPTDMYFIKRHELQWSGSLEGKAKLNT